MKFYNGKLTLSNMKPTLHNGNMILSRVHQKLNIESEMTRSSFKYRVQKYYNAIPANMKCQSLALFKVKLKKTCCQEYSSKMIRFQE